MAGNYPCCCSGGGGCSNCSGTTPTQMRVTVTGVTQSTTQCPDVADVNGVYILDQDSDNPCSWTLCVTYPRDGDGFLLGPCWLADESISMNVNLTTVGAATYVNVNFTHLQESDDCTLGGALSTANWEDSTSYGSSFDCTTLDTISTGNLAFTTGTGFPRIIWNGGTIRVEAI